MKKVERLAPYVQGEALVLSQGPYAFSLHRVARGAGGEVWWLYDETKREANNGQERSRSTTVKAVCSTSVSMVLRTRSCAALALQRRLPSWSTRMRFGSIWIVSSCCWA